MEQHGVSWAFWGGLFLIILKVTGCISMSWWLVLMPWYGPLLITLILGFFLIGWNR